MTTKEKLAEIKRLKIEVEKDLPQLIESYKAKIVELKEAMEKKLQQQLDEIHLIDPEWSPEPKPVSVGKKKQTKGPRIDANIRKLLLKDDEVSADEIITQLQPKFPKIDIKAQLQKMADPKRGKGGLNKSSDGKFSIKK